MAGLIGAVVSSTMMIAEAMAAEVVAAEVIAAEARSAGGETSNAAGGRGLDSAGGGANAAGVGKAVRGVDMELHGTVPADLPAGLQVLVTVPMPAEVADGRTLAGRLTAGPTAAKPTGAASTAGGGEAVGCDVLLQTEPADAVGGTPARAWFMWAAKPDQLGRPISIRIESAKDAEADSVYAIRHAGEMVEIAAPDGRPVLAYRHGRPDPSYKYPMTSYIHPIIGLDGEVLTDCYTRDHLHHRGLFWAWVRHERNGKDIGQWWVPKNQVLADCGLEMATGPLFARFDARHHWIHTDKHPVTQPADLDAAIAGGEKVVNEQVVCRVFRTTDTGRAIDVDLTLTALHDGISIGGQTYKDKGYGGVTLRFGADPTHSGRPRSPKVVADGQVITRDQNRLPARWIDWTAMFDGPDGKILPHRSGGALFVHPSHPPLPDAPPEWITRNYGPINVSYPGIKMLEIPRDKPLRLRYRVWIHRGDADQADVADQYAAYAADFDWKIVD